MMLGEIGRRPGSGVPKDGAAAAAAGGSVSQDREGYALAAGLALGLITLGKGRNTAGLADLNIEGRLRSVLIG